VVSHTAGSIAIVIAMEVNTIVDSVAIIQYSISMAWVEAGTTSNADRHP
jgi:hypothetical protein